MESSCKPRKGRLYIKSCGRRTAFYSKIDKTIMNGLIVFNFITIILKFYYALLTVFIFMGLQCCSQTSRIVKQDFAYRSVRNAGTIAIDDNGNQISKATDTVFVVYLETNSKEVTWER